VAAPDSTRKLTVFRDRTNSPPVSPVAKTIPQAISKMMTVLMAVARFELIASTPILPKIVVNAAKNADSSAYTHQVSKLGLVQVRLTLFGEKDF